MKKVVMILALTVLATASLFAATNLTGTWNAKVDLGTQTGSPTFVLKQDGEKLTGTYSGALGEAPLTGTVKGSDVTWDFEASGAAVHYVGKVSADGSKIEGTFDCGRMAGGILTASGAKSQ